MKNIVSVEYVKWITAERRRINKMNLDDIIWTENGEELIIDPTLIDQFDFYGLNNIDFITGGYYLKGDKK